MVCCSSSASHRAMFDSLNILIIYRCTLYITLPYLLPPCWSILLGTIYVFHILWFITSVYELPTIYDAHKVYNSICSKVGFLWSYSFSTSTLPAFLGPQRKKWIHSYIWTMIILSWLANPWSFAFFEKSIAFFLSINISLADQAMCDKITFEKNIINNFCSSTPWKLQCIIVLSCVQWVYQSSKQSACTT